MNETALLQEIRQEIVHLFHLGFVEFRASLTPDGFLALYPYMKDQNCVHTAPQLEYLIAQLQATQDLFDARQNMHETWYDNAVEEGA